MSLIELDTFDRAVYPGSTLGFSDVIEDPVILPRPRVSPPTTATVPAWLIPTQARMNELRRLGANWDQRGSGAVSVDALQFAASLLNQCMAPTTIAPSIIPLGHGGIQLVWTNSVGALEVEVVRPNEIVIYFADSPSGQEREWPATTEFSDLAIILRTGFSP